MGKMAKAAVYSLLLQLALFAILARAESLSLHPQPLEVDSFNLSLIQTPVNCKYTVIITTSCTSPKSNSDQISLAFGDGSGHQIYGLRLEDPIMGAKALSSCSSGTFHLQGPCTRQICYVYLYRTGNDAWVAGSVKIYGYQSFPPSFNFFKFVPNDTWFGFNNCGTASSAAHLRKIPGWSLYPLLAVVASLIL